MCAASTTTIRSQPHSSGPLADLGFVLAMYALVIFAGIVYFERIERPLTLWLRHGVRRRGAQLG